MIEKTGVDFKLELPHVGFHRQIGEFKDAQVSPAGEVVDEAAWHARATSAWLPSQATTAISSTA